MVSVSKCLPRASFTDSITETWPWISNHLDNSNSSLWNVIIYPCPIANC